MRTIGHFINGTGTHGRGERRDVFDPNTGAVQAQVELADVGDVNAAVLAARNAQPAWAALNPQRRARVLFRFKELIERDMDSLAGLLSCEHGKTLADARGDIQRGLEVVEFCCGIPHLLKGEHTEGAGGGIDVWSVRQPLGVVAGITPFNFPAMIPLWMLAPAIACGNAFILKPSERDPSVPVRLAQIALEAGLPAGILNVVQGDKLAVDAIVEHKDIRAVSFVGSSDIAQYVYGRGSAAGKRMQCMGGAKNHGIILPDADLDQAIPDILGAAYGSAGERCMALPVIVPVGARTAEAVRERLLREIPTLRIGTSTDPEAHFGPLVTREHKARVERYIQTAVEEGSEIVIDGRGFRMKGHESGFFLGATLLDHVKSNMKSYQEEIFGPVLQIVRAETFEEAVQYPSAHPYGNGVAIFTRNGDFARRFASTVEVGMVGINVPIPVPVAYHSFGGWKRSAFGDLNQYGVDGVRFFTRTKTITQRWPQGGLPTGDSSFVIPTMG
jgi:malonate-semialdehyde dehydrogenase (acetylating) / methylmalonate-semialdehyde dehydrogenase